MKARKSLVDINVSKLREQLLDLPEGAKCIFSREEALELVNRIDRYAQLFLRECGCRFYLLSRIEHSRELPGRNKQGRWPFCPEDLDCHPSGCKACWTECALAGGENFLAEIRDWKEDSLNKESF